MALRIMLACSKICCEMNACVIQLRRERKLDWLSRIHFSCLLVTWCSIMLTSSLGAILNLLIPSWFFTWGSITPVNRHSYWYTSVFKTFVNCDVNNSSPSLKKDGYSPFGSAFLYLFKISYLSANPILDWKAGVHLHWLVCRHIHRWTNSTAPLSGLPSTAGNAAIFFNQFTYGWLLWINHPNQAE